MKNRWSLIGKIYCVWAAIAILFSIMVAGFTAETVTRILVLIFLLAQIRFSSKLAALLPGLAPRVRFVLFGTLLACVVEGFHMISVPVFPALRIGWDTGFADGISFYLLDLLFTVPAYLVIFSVIWWFINRYQYDYWPYVLIFGLGQALGDGGLFFFLAAPGMLFFLPYPMTNYHAVNLIPFLAVNQQLKPGRKRSLAIYLGIPVIIGTYLICGALIRIAGRPFGFQ